MRLSVMTLTSVVIAPRGDIMLVSLNTMSVIEVLNSNFNVGTDKAKSNKLTMDYVLYKICH